ncbi:MAG TPA: host attachment protein [Gemmatimonadaceae bacterium]
MQRTCIAVVDATRARLFVFDHSAEVDGIHEAFSERTDLVDPARRRTPAQLFSDTRTNTSRTGGRHYGTDDHRAAHIDELDAEFARAVTEAIKQTVRDTGATRVILCASPRMLGTLRGMDLRRDGLVIDELARDYVKFTPPQIHDQLVKHGLLPAPAPRSGLRAP